MARIIIKGKEPTVYEVAKALGVPNKRTEIIISTMRNIHAAKDIKSLYKLPNVEKVLVRECNTHKIIPAKRATKRKPLLLKIFKKR